MQKCSFSLSNMQIYDILVAVSLCLFESNIRELISNHDDDGNTKTHKFAYLTMKNNSIARFARAFFMFGHFVEVIVLSTA